MQLIEPQLDAVAALRRIESSRCGDRMKAALRYHLEGLGCRLSVNPKL